MNNDATQPLELDGHVMPAHDMQLFVDELVQTYERRVLKAKVVRMDHDRIVHPTLDLDETDSTLTEDDVLTARIFPTQDIERAQKEMWNEIDAAVEHYANTIIAHARTIALYCRRTYIALSCIVRRMILTLRTFARSAHAHMSEYIRAEQRRVHEDAELRRLILAQAKVQRLESANKPSVDENIARSVSEGVDAAPPLHVAAPQSIVTNEETYGEIHTVQQRTTPATSTRKVYVVRGERLVLSDADQVSLTIPTYTEEPSADGLRWGKVWSAFVHDVTNGLTSHGRFY